MTDFRERYKRVGFGREDPGVNRALRSQRHNDQRREKRSEFYGARRDLEQDDSAEIEKEQRKRQSATNDPHADAENKVEEKIDEACLNRLKQLEKWREERNRRRLMEKKVAKPVFKVGVVHHRVYSPPINKKQAPSPPTKLCKHKENIPEPPPKRITKATKKRLEIKAMTNQQKRENMRNNRKKKSIEKIPLAPKDHQFKAPIGVSAIPLFGRKALEASQENVQLELTDNSLSSKPDFHVNMSTLCKSITDFTFSLLESSSLAKNQPSDTLNESNSDEMDQDNGEENKEDIDVEDHPPQNFNRRRSTRILNDSMIKKPQTPAKTRKLRSNFSLMDESLSNLNENESSSTRMTTRFSKIIQNGIDQSLIKFSPRQSMRLAKEATKSIPSEEINKSSPSEEITKFLSPEKAVKFSPPEETAKSLPSENTAKPLQSEEIATTSFNKTLSPEKPPVFYSPFVVASRGKSSARKELQKRNSISPQDIPTKETVMQNLNISIEEEERTAQYYKYLLNQEIDRLNGLCDSWEVVKNDESTPEDIHYLIQAAIGQTQLLINKKFKRFQSLVQDCETGKGEMLVTCKDLQGFWEMTFIEVENCNDRFKKLEELKANNWVDEEARKAEEKLKKKPAMKKSAVTKKKPAVGKSSSIRAHILAARKKMQGPSEDVEMEEPKTQMQKEIDKQAVDDSTRKTPTRYSPRISTPGSKSLLRKVQLSQSRKSIDSQLITMKINKLCKTPEVHLDDSIIYINSDRIPARSILKTCKDDIAIISAAKPTNKVLFKEQPMEIQLFDTDSESLEVINKVDTHINRTLNFEDSFSDDENKKEDVIDKQITNSKKDDDNDRQITNSKKDDDNDRQITNSKKDDDNDRQITNSKKDDDNDSSARSKSELKKELYLNSQGIVCERLIPVIEDTPNTSKLKKKKSTKHEETHDVNTETVKPATPSSQRSRKSKRHIESSDISMGTVTPNTQQRRNSKHVENRDVSTPETIRNSLRRRSSKKYVENLDLSTTAQTTTPNSLQRRNSKKHIDNFELSAVEPTTPYSLRRRNSKKHVQSLGLHSVEPATPNSQ